MNVIVVFQKETWEAAELKGVFSDDPDGLAQAETFFDTLKEEHASDPLMDVRAFRVPMGTKLDVFYYENNCIF